MILICAAGASRRMAPNDKLMLPIKGKTLLRRVAEQALQLSIPTHVALPQKPHPRWEALHGLDLSLSAHEDSTEGLSGTLRASVARLPSSVTHLCVVLADLPDIQSQDFRAVFEEVKTYPDASIWRPLSPKGQPAHPTVFHRSTFADFTTIAGDSGAKPVIEKFRSTMHEFSATTHAGSHDIDTRQDYQAYLNSI